MQFHTVPGWFAQRPWRWAKSSIAWEKCHRRRLANSNANHNADLEANQAGAQPTSPAARRGEGLRRRAARVWQLLRRTPPLVFAMAVLGVGLMGASRVFVQGIRKANDTITVTGASTERIRSDHADWSVEVSQSGSSLQASYAGLQPALERTLAFLRQAGIKPDELQTAAVKTEKEENRDPRSGELRSISWTTRQQIRISSPDVDRIAAVAASIGTLIGEGVPLTIHEPAYTYSGLADKRVDMLAKATADARGRARAIASEAGAQIGAITNADTGIFQITAPNSTETSDSGTYDTSTIDKDITAVMGVTFRVD